LLLNSANLNGPVPTGGSLLLRRDVTGIDDTEARAQERDHRWLGPGEVERRLMLAIDGNLLEVGPPHPARVLAEIVIGLAVEPVPSALHVLGGERLAVVPRNPLAQLESQLCPALIPHPALGELGNDRIDAADGLHGIEHDKPVEDGPGGHHRGKAYFLQDRQAGGIGADVDIQRSAVLLSRGW
jgi:hypothetical protein